MVGVPGKSKGCSTCRRRKKGCDQKRPICGQCASSGYVCGGYERDRTFVVHPATKAVENATFIPRSRPSTSNLAKSLDRTAITAQCRGRFWDLYMPRGDCVVRDEMILRCGHPMDWTEIIQELPGDEASLENAFSALSISRVGREDSDLRLVQESTKIYVRALKDMQLALYDPGRMLSDQVLIATMFLGLYEILEGPSPHSQTWLSHAAGAARLIELRGPQHHQTRQAHHVFLGSRAPTVFGAIIQRKATYLASQDWLTIPWATQQRTYIDRLVDLVVQLPGILEQIDASNVGERTAATNVAQLNLLHQLDSLQKSINQWLAGMKRDALPTTVPHLAQPDDEYPFENELSFANHLFVKALAVYWACSLVIAESARELRNAIEFDDEKVPYSEEDFDSTFDAKTHATNICRIIPYCLQFDMGALGASIVSFPANLAFRYFSSNREVAVTSWLTKMFKEMRNRGLQWNAQMLGGLKTRSQSRSERGDGTPVVKNEDSDSPSDRAASRTSDHDQANEQDVEFVHENPAQYYVDTSGQNG